MTTKADARQADSPATATPAATASGKSTFQTAKERLALGQARRKVLKRADHALWKAKDRKEDPLALLKRSTTGRVPELVELKNQRMACSPFGYFRGAVPVMAYDLSLDGQHGHPDELCGDAHVRNLGAFAGRTGGWSSTSTTSTRPSWARSSGT